MYFMEEKILSALGALPGRIGFYYENLVTGQTVTFHEQESYLAASVIKLYVMVEAVRQCEAGILSKDTFVRIDKSKCVPSCGALTYLHDGLEVTVQDLYTLMIILSDNSATNYLIDILGEESINQTIRAMGCTRTSLNRKMYDAQRAARGIQNYVCPAELAELLRGLYRSEVISPEASAHMLSVMKDQRLNGKIPFFIHSLPDHGRIAHKTGEDDGITHDVGIVYAKQPFILEFLGNETDVPRYERVMADIALALYEANDRDL